MANMPSTMGSRCSCSQLGTKKSFVRDASGTEKAGFAVSESGLYIDCIDIHLQAVVAAFRTVFGGDGSGNELYVFDGESFHALGVKGEGFNNIAVAIDPAGRRRRFPSPTRTDSGR